MRTRSEMERKELDTGAVPTVRGHLGATATDPTQGAARVGSLGKSAGAG